MTVDRARGDWDRVESLFDRASELTAEVRESFLAECDEEPDLVEKVRQLLASDQEATEEGFLRPPRPGKARFEILEVRSKDATPVKAPASYRCGPFRTLKEIGRGGMSVVYLAERVDAEFEQHVAIKIVASEGSEKLLERFRRERQILADLNHPNIARLIDGGVSDSGEPYLAMEWVDGQPIHRYCDEADLSVRERLNLLSVVCEAAHAAHQMLVVHRDIKPSNVLVDRDGRVKLVDFGIATELDTRAGVASQLTKTGHRMMTPQYASPEQFLGKSIGVATDVYQIGLLAYELLARRRPYELSDVPPAEAVRLVLEERPSPPSATFLDPRGFVEIPAEPPRLDTEIDAIVMKALAKETTRRYGSADLLRQDIEKYLTGLPISARSPTVAYRFNKFVKRNAVGVGLGSVAVLVMMLMALFFTQRLIEERDQTRLEAERAERLRQESEGVTEFLIDLFEVSDPQTSRGETVTARELLDRGAADLDHGLEEQRLVRARLMNTIATIYRRLGLFDSAESLYSKASVLREGETSQTAALVSSLSGLGAVLERQGRYDEAEDVLQRALALIEDVDIPENLVVFGETLHQMASLRLEQGRYEDGLGLLFRAREKLQLAPGETERLASLQDTLGTTMEELGRLEEARAAYERAVVMREDLQQEDDLGLVRTLANLATLSSRMGRLEEAAEIYERVHQIQKTVLGADHVDTLQALNNLAIIKMELGHLDEAEIAFDSIAAAWGVTRPDHPSLARVFNNRGNLALKRELGVEAEAFYRRSLAVWKRLSGPNHPNYALGMSNLGEALVLQERLSEAREVFQRSLEGVETALGNDHVYVSWPVLNLARLYDRDNQPANAGPMFRRAVELRKALGPESEEFREAEEALREFESRHEVANESSSPSRS